MDRHSRYRKVMIFLYIGLIAAVFCYIRAEIRLNRAVIAVRKIIAMEYTEEMDVAAIMGKESR